MQPSARVTVAMAMAMAMATATAASGCGSREDRRPRETGGSAPAGATAPPPADAAGGAILRDSVESTQWLLLEAHQATAARARHLAIHLVPDAETPSQVDLGESAAFALAEQTGRYASVAAHDGPRWARAAVALEGGKTRYAAEVRDARSPGQPPRVVPLGDAPPTALHLAGDALFVGQGSRLGWVDLAADAPALTELVSRKDPNKAYDLFVRTSGRLVAIDDMTFPMFADWFSLDPRGAPRRLADWRLPDVINGHYEHAALLPLDNHEYPNGSATLFLLAPYWIRTGQGQVLTAIPVRGDKLEFDADSALQNAVGPRSPVADERMPREPGQAPSLLAGKAFTFFTGMALSPDGSLVLLAAGARGVVLVPSDLAAGAPATALALGGDCRDVVTQGGPLFALVAGQTNDELVVLTATKGGYTAGARVALPGRYDRFVR